MKRSKRKISKEQILEKKLRRERITKMVWSFFLVSIMALSLLQISLYNKNNNVNLNINKIKLVELSPNNPNYGFSRYGILNKKNKEIAYVFYLPDYFKGLNNKTKEQFKDIFNKVNKSKYFGLSFNPESKQIKQIDLFRFRLYNDLISLDNEKNLNYFMIQGVSQRNKNYKLPLINCSNSSIVLPVIQLKYSNEFYIKEKDNCIIYGFTSLNDLILLHDYIVYKILISKNENN